VQLPASNWLDSFSDLHGTLEKRQTAAGRFSRDFLTKLGDLLSSKKKEMNVQKKIVHHALAFFKSFFKFKSFLKFKSFFGDKLLRTFQFKIILKGQLKNNELLADHLLTYRSIKLYHFVPFLMSSPSLFNMVFRSKHKIYTAEIYSMPFEPRWESVFLLNAGLVICVYMYVRAFWESYNIIFIHAHINIHILYFLAVWKTLRLSGNMKYKYHFWKRFCLCKYNLHKLRFHPVCCSQLKIQRFLFYHTV
jgi:hypothetical protein